MESAGSIVWNRHEALLDTAPPNLTSNAVISTSLTAESSSRSSSLLFIDSRVGDYQSLIAGTQSGTEVHVLDLTQNAIAQITQTLMGRSNISSLHILSHGSAGSLQIGSDWLSATNLERYASDLQSWSKSLTDDADILLYGCDVAEGEVGHAFVQQLAKLTSADVAASNDLTGNSALGGDWDLEVVTGKIETPLAFQTSILNQYSSILPSNNVVISQVYGGGGNSGATSKNDFIELYNRGTTAVNLNGWTVQYAASGGFNWQSTALSGSIAPGTYYLVQEAGGTNGAALPTPDATGSLAMSATDGKVALVNNTTLLTGINPTGASVIDLVGYGTANGFEGSATGSLSNTTAAIRKSGNVDNDNNANDFSVVTLTNPRNSSISSAPKITPSPSTLSYAENAGLVKIDNTFTVSDADSTNFNNGTLTVSFASGAGNDDLLLIRNVGNPLTAPIGSIIAGVDSPGVNLIKYKASNVSIVDIGTFTGGTKGKPLVVTLNANATPTTVQALMQNIAYSNLLENPVAGDRTVNFSLNDGTGWTGTASKIINLVAVNDAPVIAVPGATITLFDGNSASTPNSQGFLYQSAPNLPASTTQTGNQLITSVSEYVGYVAKPDQMPILDRIAGYSIQFNAQILNETHAGSDKNGDGIDDRAGFSVIVIGNDQKGIELGFWQDKIWAQNDGPTEPPTGSLFTHGEEKLFDTKTNAISYELKVLGNSYSLFKVGDSAAILTGSLRDYTSSVTPSFLPTNPYQTPNFLFLGDDTPTSSANFKLGAVSVITGAASTLSAYSGTDRVISGVSINDVDSGTNNVTATLSAANGILKIDSGILGSGSISGNGTGTVTLIGTIAQINTTLTNAAGLVYQSNSTFSGNDLLTIAVNDGGFNGTGGNKTDTKSFQVAIKPLPTLSINNVSQTEGKSGITNYTFTVTLSQASTEAVTVNYSTLDGSATSANDYLAKSGTLTFAAGETSKTIDIQVNGDTNFELDETFRIKLSNASNAKIGSGVDIGVGTILDDDRSGWSIAQTADFDKDGSQDILWRNVSTGGTAIWKMNGTTFVTSTPLPIADLTWNIQGVADFDKNGFVDILWRNTSTGANAIWLMNGFTVAGSVALSAVPREWSIAGLADFDKDGFTDILWHNTNTGGNAIWKMNGTSVATSIALSATSKDWQISGIGDFDKDGFVDILWHNTATGGNAFWKMNGTSVATSVSLSATDLSWQIAGVADFDKDGFTDILWRNTSTGGTAIWKMNGTSNPTSVALSFAALDAQVENITDLDGDGFVDIVWRTYSTGSNALWKMNGTNVASSIVLRPA
jgi:hypothetical protein